MAPAAKVYSVQHSNSDAQGWRTGIEDGAPSGQSGDEVWSRVHATSDSGNSQDDETGIFWSPSSNNGNPAVYYQIGTVSKRQPKVLLTGSGFNLYVHNYYGFRIEARPVPKVGSIIEFLKTDGTWYGEYTDPFLPCSAFLCRGEVGTELRCADSSVCPLQNAPTDGNGINYRKVKVELNRSWYDWTSSTVPQGDAVGNDPLRYCPVPYGNGLPNFTAFRTPKDTC